MTLAETLPLPPNQIIRRYLVSVCIAFEFICNCDSKCARLSLVYIWPSVLVTFNLQCMIVISDGSMNNYCGMSHKDMWPGLPMTCGMPHKDMRPGLRTDEWMKWYRK